MSSKIEKSNHEQQEEMLAEYSALRNEILKRMELRNQLLTFTVVIGGTLFTFGTNRSSAIILLIYPLLATCLALAWTHQDVRAGELGSYIKNHIETELPGLRWENHITTQKLTQFQTHNLIVKATEISAIGIFFFTELLVFFLAYPFLTYSYIEIVLLVLDLGALLLTFNFLRYRRNH